jgi:hypothetical protein
MFWGSERGGHRYVQLSALGLLQNFCGPWGMINRLTPNDLYMGRTAPLTSKGRILYVLFNKYRY